MTTTYGTIVSSTPQTMKADPRQVKNAAGGYVFKVGDWDRLDRFLILGTMAGTYYVGRNELTTDAVNAIRALLDKDGERVVARTVEISESGRAHKNDPALFIIALASVVGDEKTRIAALEALPSVARIPTFLFKFLNERKALGGGWGRGLRRAVAKIYEEKDLEQLAFHVIKYRQREGWTHRDVLRKAHPVSGDETRNALFGWLTGGDVSAMNLPNIVNGFGLAQSAEDVGTLLEVMKEYNLPREALPTEFLGEKLVWNELLKNMPMMAMVRNIRNMSKSGSITSGSKAENAIVLKLESMTQIRKSRMHPMHFLLALMSYKDADTYRASSAVRDALDSAFYRSFGNIKPTGKRILVALDVSSSMSGGWGNRDSRLPMTAAEVSAAMAMATVRSETNVDIRGFSNVFKDLKITRDDTLETVLRKTSAMNFGGTDCSLPMRWALENKKEYDAFVIYTDNETWAGRHGHPHQELQKYCRETGIDAKMVVVGVTATQSSIADPSDSGMLDVVGFDAGTPSVISGFISD